MNDAYEQLMERVKMACHMGMSQAETASYLNVTPGRVCAIKKKLNLEFVSKRNGRRATIEDHPAHHAPDQSNERNGARKGSVELSSAGRGDSGVDEDAPVSHPQNMKELKIAVREPGITRRVQGELLYGFNLRQFEQKQIRLGKRPRLQAQQFTRVFQSNSHRINAEKREAYDEIKRQEILDVLSDGVHRTAAEVAFASNESVPRISSQMNILAEAGKVLRERRLVKPGAASIKKRQWRWVYWSDQ